MIDDSAGNTDGLLDQSVIRLQFFVVDRPVRDIGTLDRTEFGQQAEIPGLETVKESAHQVC